MSEPDEVMKVYRDKLRVLCQTEQLAMQITNMANRLGLSEEDATVMIALRALECLKATQQDLVEAKMELPPDAFFIRDEDGTRKLVRYIGPTIQELRAECDAKGKETPVQPDSEGLCI